MKTRLFFADLLFWLHVPIVLFTFIPFFIPLSVWPTRIEWHFWYVVVVVLSQVITGLYFMKYRSFTIICPLTVWTQYLRGFKITNPKNYNHGCIVEFSKRVGVRLNGTVVRILILLIIVAVTTQYILTFL